MSKQTVIERQMSVVVRFPCRLDAHWFFMIISDEKKKKSDKDDTQKLIFTEIAIFGVLFRNHFREKSHKVLLEMH